MLKYHENFEKEKIIKINSNVMSDIIIDHAKIFFHDKSISWQKDRYDYLKLEGKKFFFVEKK